MNARRKEEIRRQFARMGVFSEKCNVYSETVTQSNSGGEIKVYTANAALSDIPCVMLFQKSKTARIIGDSISYRSTRIKLNGEYAGIAPGMKVSCSNVDYKVTEVSTEGTGVFTILDVERWL